MTIPTLLLVAIGRVHAGAADPRRSRAGDAGRHRRSRRRSPQLRAQLGLDQPIPVQFGYWLAKVAAGDFGHSITNGLPVLPLILERFQVSALIVLVAVALAACVAVPAGLIAAWRQNSALDLAIVARRHAVAVDPELLARPAAAAAVRPEARNGCR